MTPIDADGSQKSGRTSKSRAGAGDRLTRLHRKACELVQEGDYGKARRIFSRLLTATNGTSTELRALIHNDLAVLEAIEGHHDDARRAWASALETDGGCLQAALNRDLFEAEMSLLDSAGRTSEAQSRVRA